MKRKRVEDRGRSTLPGLPVFQSEARLIEATAGLLDHVPKVSGIRILHGGQETGKDIVFIQQGALDERLHCACVVKNNKISGKVGTVSGARTILQQVQQALDTPYIDPSGSEISISRVYVVTPFEISPEAITSISGMLKGMSGQVAFLAGHGLFGLFKKYWPDFFLDEATAIERYLAVVRRDLLNSDAMGSVASMYDLGNLTERETKIYVYTSLKIELTGFVVDVPIIEVLPESSRFDRKFDEATINDVVRKLSDLTTLLKNLADWGFHANPDGTLLDTKFMIAQIRQCGDDIKNAWEVAVKKHFGRGSRAELPQPPLKPKTFLIDFRSSVSLSKLKNTILPVANTLNQLLGSLNAYISKTDPIVPLPFVLSEEFPRLQKLQECLNLARSPCFRPYKSKDVSLGKNLLNTLNASVLIVGPPGSGKTTYCRWNALNDAERYTAAESDVVPVYVPLHRLSTGPIPPFEEVFLRPLSRTAIVGDAFREWAEGKIRLRLYLDGLDEIPDMSRRKAIMEWIRLGTVGNQRLHAIVTARDYVHAPWLHWLPRLVLAGLDQEEIKNLVHQWLLNKDDEGKFFHQLSALPIIASLMRTPLLATLIILMFRRTGRLPESRGKLYLVAIELLCGGWDIAKGIPRPSRFGRETKLLVGGALALSLHKAGKKEFSARQLRQAAAKSIIGLSEEAIVHLQAELTEDGLITGKHDTLEFTHLSFQEFLAARSLVGDPTGRGLKTALESILRGEDWWAEVFRFYVSLAGNPGDLILWLRQQLGRRMELPDRAENILDLVKDCYPLFPINGEVS